MRVQVALFFALIVCIALVGLMKVRRKEHEKEEKRNRMQVIKLRVTDDVLTEYHSAIAEKNNQLEKAKSDQKTMEEEMAKLRDSEEKIKQEADLCQENQKSDADKLAVISMDLTNLKETTGKEKTAWNTEIDGLKKQVQRSALCDLLKNGPSNARKICGNEEPHKAEEEKSEKKEQPKKEAPKQEQPKKEAPKQEQPKEEAPKQEQPKEEAPKQEQPKEDVPKQEQPKEDAKQEGEAKA